MSYQQQPPANSYQQPAGGYQQRQPQQYQQRQPQQHYGAAPAAAASSSNNQRAELFSGAQPRAGAGAYAHQQPPHQQQQALDDMDSRQLMQHAVAQHKDTTATAKRALQVVEQTREIQATTQAALGEQRLQMVRIEDDMERIGQDLSYSERILRFMKMCCCFSFFCACCTEPDRAERDRDWRSGAGAPPPQYIPPPGSQQAGKHKPQKQKSGGWGKNKAAAPPPPPASYPNVTTRGLDEAGFGDEARTIQAETAQQNAYLDEIAKGLDQLKHGAVRMNEELRYQDAHANRIRNDAEALEVKLHSVNREGFKRI